MTYEFSKNKPISAEENSETEEKRLQAFKEEMQSFHEKQMEAARFAKEKNEKSEEATHFADPEFDVNELTAEDMKMWEKINDGSLTWGEYEQYRSSLNESGELQREKMKMSSRGVFFDVVGNKAQRVLLRKPRENAQN
ncbi:MAG: hypothetical protein AAB652_00505 [Patescibacteria group bacterium]